MDSSIISTVFYALALSALGGFILFVIPMSVIALAQALGRRFTRRHTLGTPSGHVAIATDSSDEDYGQPPSWASSFRPLDQW